MLENKAIENAQKVVSTLVKSNGIPQVEKLGFILTACLSSTVLIYQRYLLRKYNRDLAFVHSEDDTQITSNLYRSFIKIARICLPTWKSRELLGSMVFIGLFAVHAVLRVWASRVHSRMLATMLSGSSETRMETFLRSIVLRSAVSLLEGLCSGAIQWIRPWLIGCYRERLSSDFQRRYFQKLVYYQASVLDDRTDCADSVITSYCGEFAEHFAELPYYFLLPGLEMITSGYALIQQSGPKPAATVGSIATIGVVLLQHIAPPFGRLHSLLLQRADDYRRLLSNTLENVENIALHGAGSHTLMCLRRALSTLKRSLDHMALASGHFNMLETVLSSFLTIVANLIAFFSAERGYYKHSVNDVLLQVQYIESLNCSVKNLIVNFRELSHLTEFSVKMWEFDKTLNSIASGTFLHTGPKAESKRRRRSATTERLARVYSPTLKGNHEYSADVFPLFSMSDVVLHSPTGVVLLDHITAEMKSNEDWVITGENGVGKTSMIRMLVGLWFPSSGRLTVDSAVKFLIAPQHTYMAPSCTLYEQIVFPMEAPPNPDAFTIKCIKEAVHLAGAESVIEVAGGYESPFMGLEHGNADTSFDWTRLSGGQKQRVSLARIFFYKLHTASKTNETLVAVLDEATSMMDEFEQDVINNMRSLGIRMISITHREVVIRHHSHLLRVKKNGKWSLDKVPHQLNVGERAQSVSPTSVPFPRSHSSSTITGISG